MSTVGIYTYPPESSGEMAGMAGPSSSARLTEHLDDDGVLGRAVIVVYSIGIGMYRSGVWGRG